ncbi:hypothetical protein WDZ16_03895 [Pseudokineococcus marinus]|uniref:Uncharacterized protein n=1 Tax=Pseudokineococcus marinus TaxID=351215 RepID=A0A849BQB0_9ACTN|nr:hypothetical protein [Pseudokineococcus marinus]NNH23177.1 hypothetical protein [Pseudokineococcus marinus]
MATSESTHEAATTAAVGDAPAGSTLAAERPVPRQHVAVDPVAVDPVAADPVPVGAVAPGHGVLEHVFERPATAGAPAPTAWVVDLCDDVRPSADDVRSVGPVATGTRGTALQAMAGWGGALVVGAACWAGALTVLTRVL